MHGKRISLSCVVIFSDGEHSTGMNVPSSIIRMGSCYHLIFTASIGYPDCSPRYNRRCSLTLRSWRDTNRSFTRCTIPDVCQPGDHNTVMLKYCHIQSNLAVRLIVVVFCRDIALSSPRSATIAPSLAYFRGLRSVT